MTSGSGALAVVVCRPGGGRDLVVAVSRTSPSGQARVDRAGPQALRPELGVTPFDLLDGQMHPPGPTLPHRRDVPQPW